MDEICESVLVSGQPRPDKLECLNQGSFPQSLARFGLPAHPAIHQTSIHEDSPMLLQGVAGAKPSDEEGEFTWGDSSVQ